MKIEGFQTPKSSFLSVEKDMGLIVDKFFKNERLKKLLYYTTPDAMDKPKVPEDAMYEMFGKNIKIVPKLVIDSSVLNYIIISYDNFVENRNNPEFRDNIIEFDIICHFDQWHLKDFQLRPYRIAAEIDSMIDNKRLTGIGQMQFLGASQIILTDEFAGLCLMYQAIHGEEDRKFFPNPEEDKQFVLDFKEMMQDD